MITSNKTTFSAIFLLLLFTAAGCGSTGATKNSTVYSHDYYTLVKAAENAIRNSQFNLRDTWENEKKTTYEILFSEGTSIGNDLLKIAPARVVIHKINEKEASMEIINPEYPFTVPADQRQNYRPALTKMIEKSLAESS